VVNNFFVYIIILYKKRGGVNSIFKIISIILKKFTNTILKNLFNNKKYIKPPIAIAINSYNLILPLLVKNIHP